MTSNTRTDLPPGHKLGRLEYLDALDDALARARNIRSVGTAIKRKGETVAEMRARMGLVPQRIVFSAKASKLVAESILNPPKPTPAMRALMGRKVAK